ncbi:MAG: polyprenyl synthetase family protein [Candidatus Levybacteria bacterium]|nr:polyprenyl synthetase family protein [Candidatus Levybacteria bacterium]
MVDIHAESNLGGKKFRGALVQLGYESAGGQDRDGILRASLAFEVVHNAFLVHDDIMDNTDLRRGRLSVHRRYATLGEEKFPTRDADHFGVSMGINVGDLGAATAYEILIDTNFPPEKVLAAIRRLNRVIIMTTFGEALDLGFNPLSPDMRPRDILRLHLYKTAEYSFAGPLQLGAILADADVDTLLRLSKFALPLGISFQIKDDILGMFASEQLLGKPVDSDIKEGKNTLLILKARELGNLEEQEFLDYAYGNPRATQEDLERIRQIVKSTGSLEYSEGMMRRLADNAKRNATKITSNPQWQTIFYGLADLMTARDK